MRTDAKSIAKFLKVHDNYLITAHRNADGDAYASMLAIAHILREMGKSYRIVIHDEVPDVKYSFLAGFNEIKSYDEKETYRFDAAVAVDVPTRDRMGRVASILPQPENCAKIDHHPVEDDFAEYEFISTGASSTSQLVYDVVEQAGVEMTDDLAATLFAGIMYDTGRFSFTNTSQRDFEICSQLLKFNVSPSKIANHLFFDNSFQSMRTIGYGLNNLESHLDGRLAIIYLPLEVMQKNNHSEIEELANYAISLKTAEVGLFIREIKPGYFKVSLRSKGRVSVKRIAQEFGGGGHEHAAGCRYEGDIQTLRNKIVEVSEKYISEFK